MTNPKFVHIIWTGTELHSVQASRTVVQGEIKPGEDITAKWKGRSYGATIVAVGNDKPPLVAAMKKACEPDTVQQLKSLKCKQKAAQKSIQKARKEFHSEFYEEEEEVPPLPPPLPIMQLMSTTTTVPVTTMQDILPTTNTGRHVVPALQAATLPTTTHHVIPSLPAATLPTTRHHVLPALPAATLPTTRHHVIPALPAATLPTTRQHVIPALPAATLPTTRHHVTPSLPAATLPSTSHHVVPAFPAATFPTTSHHFIPALPAATLPTTSHQVEPAATLQPPPLFADLLDDGLLEVLRSVEQSEGGLNDVQPFVSLSREVADIKERLARLEDIISSNSSSIRKTNDGSATVQLILSNTTLGWKLALRKLLLLKFGVNMLGNSCAVGRKDAKFNKLDEAKLLEIKEMIFATYAGTENSKDLTPQTFNSVVNSACAVARRSAKNMT